MSDILETLTGTCGEDGERPRKIRMMRRTLRDLDKAPAEKKREGENARAGVGGQEGEQLTPASSIFPPSEASCGRKRKGADGELQDGAVGNPVWGSDVLGVLGDRAVSTEEGFVSEGEKGADARMGSSSSRNDRMVGRDEDEAAGLDLVDALRSEEENFSSGDDSGGTGENSAAPSPTNCLPYIRETASKRGWGWKTRIPTIYLITSPSGKMYVGQTVWFAKRMKKHESGNSQCRALNNAIRLYGWDRMKIEVLHGGADAIGGSVDEADLNNLEIAAIKRLNTYGANGYNLTPGGDVNPMRLPEVREMVRKMHESGVIKEAQRKAWTNPQAKKRQSNSQKKRISNDPNWAERLKVQVEKNGAEMTKASHSDDARAKRAATWAAKLEAKLLKFPEDERDEQRRKILRNRGSYKRQCELAGGADVLREKRRQWREARKAKRGRG